MSSVADRSDRRSTEFLEVSRMADASINEGRLAVIQEKVGIVTRPGHRTGVVRWQQDDADRQG